MSSSAAIICPICQKQYSRLDHLQRHLPAHTSTPLFGCDACGKAFKRKDVLARHSTTCHVKLRLDPDGACIKRVRSTRRACDRCASQKRACNSGHPCSNCLSTKRACSYQWLDKTRRTLDESPKTQRESSNHDKQVVSSLFPPAIQSVGGNCYAEKGISNNKGAVGGRASEASWDFLDDHTMNVVCFETIGNREETQQREIPALDTPSPLKITDTNDHCVLAQDPTDSFNFLMRFTSRSTFGLTHTFSIDRQLSEQAQENDDETGDNSSLHEGLPASDYENGLFKQYNDVQSNFHQPLPSSIWFADDVLNAVHCFETTLPQCSQTASFFGSGWHEPFYAFEELMFSQPSRSLTGTDVHDDELWAPAAVNQQYSSKCRDILSSIRETTISESCRSNIKTGGWTPFLDAVCADFFSPSNLHRFIELYWAVWYPNWPTIHKPTFDTESAPPALLACMALIGACLSSFSSDRDKARFWFDTVEEMVFSDEATYNLAEASCKHCRPENIETRIRAIQASYAICVLQTWEGQEAAKGRIRRQRYGMIISAARDLMPYAKHTGLTFVTPHSFRWQDFTLKEELIRTLLYVFLLDTAFTIFHNLPPRMVIRELTLDLACPEPCFQAISETTCFEMIRRWKSHHLGRRHVPLYAAIRSLHQKDIDIDSQQFLAQSGALNLWTIINAFHVLLYNVDPGFSSSSQCTALRSAIMNWRTVWNLRLSDGFLDAYGLLNAQAAKSEKTARCSWKRIGFMSNAPEYWLLARLFLERLESIQQSVEAAESLSGYDKLHYNVAASILPKYDESSMDQLNGFISSFEGLKMSD